MNNLLESMAQSASFLAVTAAVTAGLLLIACFCQKRFVTENHNMTNAKQITFTGIFSAIAAILMLFELPLPLIPSFYELDFSELPVLICSFYSGPLAGVICELLKIILKILIKGPSAGFIGDFANFFIGCSLVIPAAIIYHYRKSKKAALVGLIIGVITMTGVGSLFNGFFLLPQYAKMFGLNTILQSSAEKNSAISSLSDIVIFATVPFNLFKGIILSVLTFLLYKRVEKLLLQK